MEFQSKQTKGKALLPPLTHSSPSPTEKCPRSPSQRGGEPSAGSCLSPAEDSREENAHIKELKKYHLQLQQVCNMCVSMCEHVSACEYNYYSAHEWVCMYSAHECREQCCRLCDNPILFKMYNEKFRGATYITVFDGICQFLTTLRKLLIMLRAHHPT